MVLVQQEVWQALRDAEINGEEPPDTPPQNQGNIITDPRDNETPAGLSKVFHDI